MVMKMMIESRRMSSGCWESSNVFVCTRPGSNMFVYKSIKIFVGQTDLLLRVGAIFERDFS